MKAVAELFCLRVINKQVGWTQVFSRQQQPKQGFFGQQREDYTKDYESR